MPTLPSSTDRGPLGHDYAGGRRRRRVGSGRTLPHVIPEPMRSRPATVGVEVHPAGREAHPRLLERMFEQGDSKPLHRQNRQCRSPQPHQKRGHGRYGGTSKGTTGRDPWLEPTSSSATTSSRPSTSWWASGGAAGSSKAAAREKLDRLRAASRSVTWNRSASRRPAAVAARSVVTRARPRRDSRRSWRGCAPHATGRAGPHPASEYDECTNHRSARSCAIRLSSPTRHRTGSRRSRAATTCR